MMTLLFGIKDVIWWSFFSKIRTQLLSGKLSYPFTFCANLMKLAEYFRLQKISKILEET